MSPEPPKSMSEGGAGALTITLHSAVEAPSMETARIMAVPPEIAVTTPFETEATLSLRESQTTFKGFEHYVLTYIQDYKGFGHSYLYRIRFRDYLILLATGREEAARGRHQYG